MKADFHVESQTRSEAGAWCRSAWQVTYLLQPHQKKQDHLKLSDLLPDETLIAAGLKKPKGPPPKSQDRQKMWKDHLAKFDGV
tara:strand:- start:12622 stop:12870 length:249 start_codon:yes stop_codon:yes gene_type:complete